MKDTTKTTIKNAIETNGTMGFSGMNTSEVWDFIHENETKIPNPEMRGKVMFFRLGNGFFTVYKRNGRKLEMVAEFTNEFDTCKIY